jgi:hypothetical protein
MALTNHGYLQAAFRFLHLHHTNSSFFRPFSTVVGYVAASADALLHFVPVASDASTSSGATGLHQKAAIGAVENDGGDKCAY